MTAMRRKPNVEERRRELCDAAIELLAEDGARGLTHLRVDRRAGVADGTTSFYYQTRSALLRGAIDRVVSQDVDDFTTAMAAAKEAVDDHTETLLSQLALQAMRTAVEPERSRARARFELMMIAARDPELGAVFDGLMDTFRAIGEEAVAQVQPSGSTAGSRADPRTVGRSDQLPGRLFVSACQRHRRDRNGARARGVPLRSDRRRRRRTLAPSRGGRPI